MRFLRVFLFRLIAARRIGHVTIAERLTHGAAQALDAFLGDIDAVGAHIPKEADRIAADIDAFIQTLRRLHRARDGEAELARRFLLQRRGRERRRRIAAHRLGVDFGDDELAGLHRRERAVRGSSIANIEAADLLAFKRGETRGECVGLRAQRGVERPIFLRFEALDLHLAIGDQAQCNGLDAPGAARARQLAPKHGG